MGSRAAMMMAGAAALACARPAAAVRGPDDTTSALPCRPTIACTAEIAPGGTLELELGYIARRVEQHFVHATPLLVKLSLRDWLQLQLGTNGGVFEQAERDHRYLDDLTPSLKVRFLEQGVRAPALALSVGANLPTFARDGYLRTYDLVLLAFASKELGGRLGIDLNAGATLYRLEQPVAQPMVALALAAKLPRGFVAMLEGYWFGAAQPISPADAGVLIGFSYAPRPWLVVDLGVDIGLVRETRGLSTFVGLTVAPVVLWGRGKRPQAAP